jgi:hypothetical protein
MTKGHANPAVPRVGDKRLEIDLAVDCANWLESKDLLFQHSSSGAYFGRGAGKRQGEDLTACGAHKG